MRAGTHAAGHPGEVLHLANGRCPSADRGRAASDVAAPHPANTRPPTAAASTQAAIARTAAAAHLGVALRQNTSQTAPCSADLWRPSTNNQSFTTVLALSCGSRARAVRCRRVSAGRGPITPSRASGATRALRSRAISLRSASIVLLSFGLDAGFAEERLQARHFALQGRNVPCRAASFLRLLDGRRQLAPALAELPLQGTRSGTRIHLRPAQLFRPRVRRVRPRPFPLRTGMRPLIQQLPVARRAHRLGRCRGGRPGSVVPGRAIIRIRAESPLECRAAVARVRRQVCSDILVENRHALDDSAWRRALPAPLWALIPTSMMIPTLAPTRFVGTLTMEFSPVSRGLQYLPGDYALPRRTGHVLPNSTRKRRPVARERRQSSRRSAGAGRRDRCRQRLDQHA